jgi:hypothetical protein
VGLIDFIRLTHSALSTYDSPFSERVRGTTNAALASILLRLAKHRGTDLNRSSVIFL